MSKFEITLMILGLSLVSVIVFVFV